MGLLFGILLKLGEFEIRMEKDEKRERTHEKKKYVETTSCIFMANGSCLSVIHRGCIITMGDTEPTMRINERARAHTHIHIQLETSVNSTLELCRTLVESSRAPIISHPNMKHVVGRKRTQHTDNILFNLLPEM